jgi:hypothetical protein
MAARATKTSVPRLLSVSSEGMIRIKLTYRLASKLSLFSEIRHNAGAPQQFYL